MRSIKRILLCLMLLAALGAAEDAVRNTVRRAEPEYPELARKMNLHGVVKLKVWITPEGSVRRLEYIGGHPLLADAALTSVKQWKFATAPKETTQVVELRF